MKMRTCILLLLCFGFTSFNAVSSTPPTSQSGRGGDSWGERFYNDGNQVFRDLKDTLKEYKLDYVAATLSVLWAVSLMQKQNPDFFNAVTRGIEFPFLVVKKRMELIFCKGQSVTWNELISWHNRVMQLLSPLTKATSVIDLSKDRRLRSIDQEDDQATVGTDENWLKQAAHVRKECTFIIKNLKNRLSFYEDQQTAFSKKQKQSAVAKMMAAPGSGVEALGKRVVRTSLKRHSEIAFYLKEAITYLEEIVAYTGSVTHAGALDKEHLKKLMQNTCSTFDHLSILADELTAADRNKKRLTKIGDTGMSGGGYHGGGYDSHHYAGGYNG